MTQINDDPNWMPGRGGFATAYMPPEKKFLSGVFERFPNLRSAFRACEKIYPPEREHQLRVAMASSPRRVWADFGIPEKMRETLAEHTGHMSMIAHSHPQRAYGFGDTIEMVSLWGLPLVLADEIPLHEMDRPQRHELRKLAARMVFDYYENRESLQRWKELDSNHRPVSKWVNDLDYLATARKAREYQLMFPTLAPQLELLVDSCQRSLMTEEAKKDWSAIVPDNKEERLSGPIVLPGRYRAPAPAAWTNEDQLRSAFSSAPAGP